LLHAGLFFSRKHKSEVAGVNPSGIAFFGHPSEMIASQVVEETRERK
jgi:hypothetical protein